MDANVIEDGFQRVWKMFEETGRKFQETEKMLKEQFQETGRKFQETEKMLREQSQETDRKFQETDRKFREADKKFDKHFGKIKELDRNWGKLVEALVKPSVGQQFRKWGIPVEGSGQRVEKQKGGESIEIDILLTDTDSIVLVEVKTTLTVEHVDEHIEKHLKKFRKFFKEYRDHKMYGAVAYIHTEENADRYAYKKGLFVLTFTAGDMVEIRNDEKFVPVLWE